MSDNTGNGDAVMAAETGTVQGGNSVPTDLVMEGLEVQLSPSLQDGAESKANARAIAYRDRILETAADPKRLHKA